MTTYAETADASTLIDSSQPFSRVDRLSRFDGRYEAMQNLVIEGSCSGEIDCRGTLVVADGAVVNAKIIARDVRIAGEVEGEIECSGKFELLPTARASGTVRARQIVVHEGAEYDGELEMVTDGVPAAERTEDTEERRQPASIPAQTGPAAVVFEEEDEEEPEPEAAPQAEPAAAAQDLPDFLRRRE